MQRMDIMCNFIIVGCDKCNKFGIVPEESQNPFIGGMNVPMISTLSILSKTCLFCHSEIVHSTATRKDIDKYSRSIEAGPVSRLFDLKEIMHTGKI